MSNIFELREGRIYTVAHSLRGRFDLLLTGLGTTWVRGRVIRVLEESDLPENRMQEGRVVDLRRAHITEILQTVE